MINALISRPFQSTFNLKGKKDPRNSLAAAKISFSEIYLGLVESEYKLAFLNELMGRYDKRNHILD